MALAPEQQRASELAPFVFQGVTTGETMTTVGEVWLVGLQELSPQGLLAPAWVVALALSAWLGVRAAMQIKGSSGGQQGQGRYQGRMLAVVERMQDLQEDAVEERRQTQQLIAQQTETLERVSTRLQEHNRQAREYRRRLDELHEEVVGD